MNRTTRGLMDVMFPRDSNLLKDTTEVGDVRAEIASGRHVLHERPLCLFPGKKVTILKTPCIQLVGTKWRSRFIGVGA
jgi:hypothetical protein